MAEGLRVRVGDDVTYGLRLRLHGNRLIWQLPWKEMKSSERVTCGLNK